MRDSIHCTPWLCCLFLLAGNVTGFLSVRQPVDSRPALVAVAIDPSAIISSFPLDVSLVAVVSASAGAMSQQPRIMQLESELEGVRSELAGSNAVMEAKVNELEDRLFEMDKEYEGQTARFKRNYDTTMKTRFEELTAKVKEEFQYNLEIKMEKQRSDLLTDKLSELGSLSSKQQEVSKLKLQKQVVDDANLKLERALLESQAELEKLQKTEKKRFLFF